MKKLLSIIFSLSIIFTMCTSNLRTFSDPRNYFRYSENALNNLYYPCKDENNFTHLCNDEDLTFEKINNMTLDEFKAKYKSDYLDMDELYAISKLKCGEKHVTINDGNVHHEYFRVNAVDEILNFFKTKYNYGKKDFEQNCEKNLNKSIALYTLPFAALCGIGMYLICSQRKDLPEKSKECKDKNCEKNKQPLSQKFKIICSAIGSVVGGIVGGALGALHGNIENAINLSNMDSTYRTAKHYASWAFNKVDHSYHTDHWTDNDILRFKMNMNDPDDMGPSYEYYNVGIGYSEDEQKTINEEYETLYKRVNNEIYKNN